MRQKSQRVIVHFFPEKMKSNLLLRKSSQEPAAAGEEAILALV